MANENENENTDEVAEARVVEWVEQPLLQRAKLTSDGRILKGIDAEDAPFGAKDIWVLCLHSVDIPLPSDDPTVIAQSCVRTVNHPLMGAIQQFAIGMDAGLAMMECAKALERRDARIDDLEQKLADALERLDQQEQLTTALADKHGWPETR